MIDEVVEKLKREIKGSNIKPGDDITSEVNPVSGRDLSLESSRKEYKMSGVPEYHLKYC